MKIETKLREIVNRLSLLKHPFYKSWSDGTLPYSGLTLYATEYGAFIQTLPFGWKTLHDDETTYEELEHIVFWEEFAHAVNTHVLSARLSQTQSLVKTAEKLFSKKSTALGALFAFEVQQPKTSQSKLDGLKKFYKGVNKNAYQYFEIHSHNEHESEKLLRQLSKLSLNEQKDALYACKTMCQALWDGLSGIHDQCPA